MVDGLEEQGMETVSQRHLGRKGTDLDLVEQLNIYEVWDTHKSWDHKENIARWYLPLIKDQISVSKCCSHPVSMTPYSIYST